MALRSRRKMLACSVSALFASIAGCTDTIDQFGGDDGDDLEDQWQEYDDYPDDDFRNLKLSERDLAPLLSVDGEIETTFGYYTETIVAPSEERGEAPSVELEIEGEEEIDVYIIPEDVASEFHEDRDLSSFDHIPEYSESGTTDYNQVVRMESFDDIYTLIVTLGDVRPPTTTEEEVAFVEEHEDILLSGSVEYAVYIPLEEYKENEGIRVLYDDSGDFEIGE